MRTRLGNQRLPYSHERMGSPKVSWQYTPGKPELCRYLQKTRKTLAAATGLNPSAVARSRRFSYSGVEREHDRKHRTLAGFALDPNFAAMPLHQPARNRQAQAQPQARRGIVFAAAEASGSGANADAEIGVAPAQADEGLENFQLVFMGDAGAGIAHADADRVGLRPALGDWSIGLAPHPDARLPRHVHAAAARGELQRVLEQNRNRSLQLVRIAGHGFELALGPSAKGDTLFPERARPGRGQLGHQGIDVALLRVERHLAVFEASVGKAILDDALHAHAGIGDLGGGLELGGFERAGPRLPPAARPRVPATHGPR